MAISLNPATWLNLPMLREPLNWAIVGVVASIWLMAFHAIMTGFSAMSSGGRASIGGGGPGTIAAPLAAAPGVFSVAGDTGGMVPFANYAGGDGNQWFGSNPIWGPEFQAKYAEDGWTGENP